MRYHLKDTNIEHKMEAFQKWVSGWTKSRSKQKNGCDVAIFQLRHN